jgi:hypothetical protein
MATYETKLQTKDVKSAAALIEEEKSGIDFYPAAKEGKLYFTCGSKKGYVSPAVTAAAKAGTLQASDMLYSECSQDGNIWVPCLSLKKKAVYHFE